MDTPLNDLLAGQAPVDRHIARWADGSMPLCVTSYLTGAAPPVEYVTSARCVGLCGPQVLLCRNADSIHVLPGGRLEAGESEEQAIERELMEEAGCHIGNLRRLGFMHLQHQAPKPAGYRYPYPDFLWSIFAGTVLSIEPKRRLADDYEVEASLVPVEQALGLGLSAGSHIYLRAALDARP